MEGESHDEGECFEPVPTGGADRAPSCAARGEQFLEVAVDFVANVGGKRSGEKRWGGGGRKGGLRRVHSVLNAGGSTPRHIRSAALRASRNALAPAASSFT